MALGAILVPFSQTLQTEEFNNLPMRQQVRRGFQEVGSSSRSWGKNLAVIGAVFSCTECFVEKTRGRTDRWNPVFGGCITGGVLAVRAAPTRETASRPSPHAPAKISARAPSLTAACSRALLRTRRQALGHRAWRLAALGSPPSPTRLTCWALASSTDDDPTQHTRRQHRAR